MSTSSALRFPISGREDEFFLLEVTSTGSKPLDLKLLGSEGEEIYLTKLRHRRVVEHKASTAQCTDSEWEAILTAVLLKHKHVHDIEVKADFQDQNEGQAISLSFRKKIQGISQRLGTISLPLLPEEDRDEANQISPFHLCVQVLGERAELQTEAIKSSEKIRFLEESVQDLKDQLQDLIKAKESDETILLEKFRDLLNEKKVKIRQQQRLLASVDVGSRPVGGNDDEELEDAKPTTSAPRRKAKSSRPAKRRLESTASNLNADNDIGSSASPDAMDVDDNSGRNEPQLDPEVEDRMTTDEDETADEAEDSDVAPTKPVARSKPMRTAAAKSTSTQAPSRTTRRGHDKQQAAPEVKSEPASQATSTDDVPPAKRELPFMRNKKKAPAPPPKAATPAADDDETGPDDEDEL